MISVGRVVSWRCSPAPALDIDDRREQHHAVDRNVAVGEIAGQPRRARGAVAFAADKERRAPEVVFVQETADELAEGRQIVLHAPEVGAVAGLVRAAEARAHGVDEDQVAGIQQAVGIVDVGVRRRRRQAVGLQLHHLGAEGAHVQPDGGRARSAVEQKPDRPFGLVGDAVLGIVDVKQMPLAHAAGGVVNGHEPDVGGVLDRLAFAA